MIRPITRKILGNNLYNKLKKSKNFIVYRGSEYECPICNSKLKRFMPGEFDFPVIKKYNIIGAGYYENLACPICFSYNRDRLLFLFLKRRTEIFKKKMRLLHIAPEKEMQKIFKKTGTLDYISADLTSPLADVKMDITNIPLSDESFDVVICNHVLEHIKEDIKAMSEIYRVLRRNGWAIMQVPISYILEKTYEDFSIIKPEEREQHFGQYDHVRIYAKDYFERLAKVGFTIETIEPGEYLDRSEIHKYAIIPDEKMIFCKKI